MKYFAYLYLIFVVSCANNEEKPEVKTYSEETNRAFEMIERGGSYYLKKPPAQSTVQPVRVKPREEIVVDEKINYQETLKPVKKSPPKVDERLVEINQNLAFYCMKHRKDPRFGDSEEKCMQFVNKSLSECQKIHKTPNNKLLGCVQTKLKRR